MLGTIPITVLFGTIMEKLGPFEDHPRLAVAVSGGSDSLALMLLLHAWVKEAQGQIIALTVDHQLRSESRTEAYQVAAWCKAHGIEHHILTRPAEALTHNIQKHAREARYKLLSDFCKKHAILHLFTAHHSGDQAETLLMRLFRGSGVEGLSGIRAVSYFYGIRILRPLLSYDKEVLQQWLVSQHQPWINDPSNENPCFTRTSMRHMLNLACKDQKISLAQLHTRLSQSAQAISDANILLERQVLDACLRQVTLFPEGCAHLDIQKFILLEKTIALRLLTKLLCCISSTYTLPRYESLQRIWHRMCHDKTIDVTLHGCRIYRYRNRKNSAFILIFREPIAISKQNTLYWDNRYMIKTTLSLSKPLGIYTGQLWCHQKPSSSRPYDKKIIFSLPVLQGLDCVESIAYIDHYEEDHTIITACFKPRTSLTGN